MTDLDPAAAAAYPSLYADDVDCADGDVEQFIGDPVGDDEVDVAIDAMLAGDEADLDGDGQPDPPDDDEAAGV